ncbi:probable pgm2-phosphoglucomutase [Lichtheimia corymbifera JMRC:FSU:9682]|uniref:phosphoglucomutase (alpha-D-glucose-1,6-bisphosphate-dependent) n=1 Tax=Lichtheimia corymbifera JMRC:FSU:9682 TaxID=1263082 RepID=A0A068SB95_9FUNG|nr:probable pgm2-phosphoglucomutase [Lichtheimia corymbifera JMRC:FSU:9682]
MGLTMVDIKTVPTQPYDDQKPGTSGLRKRVKVFQQQNYTENFIQSVLHAVENNGKGATLVVGGDGRYYLDEVMQIIIKFSVAAGVSRLIVPRHGLLSTPAGSHLIRKLKATGGIILTASHNPGGPDKDFGIKYNGRNGGPAPENVTDRIFQISKGINELRYADIPRISYDELGTQNVGDMVIEVIDGIDDYVALMKEIFDFNEIKTFLQSNKNFKVLFDGMHGVTGIYGERIFVQEFGLPPSSIMRSKPLPDFGGEHPDPNLTYAHELVERVEKEQIDFGAASDGDGDRNMVIGKNAFVSPCDSVAVIAHYACEAIPYFRKQGGIRGLARSMPTSRALDLVAKKQGVECFEVPTGWKFFGNLMDAGRCSICGEESFGTGSDHVREKDGVWAILAWLSIVVHVNKSKPGTSIYDILQNHYKIYGRNFFSRYDYEEVDSRKANDLVENLRGLSGTSQLLGQKFGPFKVSKMDDFTYDDPIDNSVASHQGMRVMFEDGSRFVVRLSGTGSQGATVRLYVEKYSSDPSEYTEDTQKALKPLIDVALEITKLQHYTGRDRPTVIT